MPRKIDDQVAGAGDQHHPRGREQDQAHVLARAGRPRRARARPAGSSSRAAARKSMFSSSAEAVGPQAAVEGLLAVAPEHGRHRDRGDDARRSRRRRGRGGATRAPGSRPAPQREDGGARGDDERRGRDDVEVAHGDVPVCAAAAAAASARRPAAAARRPAGWRARPRGSGRPGGPPPPGPARSRARGSSWWPTIAVRPEGDEDHRGDQGQQVAPGRARAARPPPARRRAAARSSSSGTGAACRRPRRRSPMQASTASQRCWRKTPVRMRNSPANELEPGMASEAMVTIRKMPASRGAPAGQPADVVDAVVRGRAVDDGDDGEGGGHDDAVVDHLQHRALRRPGRRRPSMPEHDEPQVGEARVGHQHAHGGRSPGHQRAVDDADRRRARRCGIARRSAPSGNSGQADAQEAVDAGLAHHRRQQHR